MEVHKICIDRKEQHDVNCFINLDNNNNQLVLTRSIPLDGEVGLASATIKFRLGRWECIVQAGGNILEPFGLDFEFNLRKNLYVVMEMLGERNGWKCFYGYKEKVEFGAECKGVFKRIKHTNSRTYNCLFYFLLLICLLNVDNLKRFVSNVCGGFLKSEVL